MEYVRLYFITNFILLCISAIMLFIAFQGLKNHKRMSICIILITAIAIFLSLDEILQTFYKAQANVAVTTVLAFLGYILRPVCVVLFIILSNSAPKGKLFYIFFMPLVLNAVLFCFCFVPGVREYIFYFVQGEDSLAFHGGYLRFASHATAALYLIYFLVATVRKLKTKHMASVNILFICAALIVASVTVETLLNDNDDVRILNTSIMVSVMFYYLFLYMETGRYDTLTGLFNRDTFYQDTIKMEKEVVAIVQLDMDGLKYFNDNFGHLEGDNGLKTIANAISEVCDKDMYAYRISGDEFLIIVINLSKDVIDGRVAQIKAELARTKFSASIGIAYRTDKNKTIEDLIKESEQQMYVQKEEFYKHSKFERRKIDTKK